MYSNKHFLRQTPYGLTILISFISVALLLFLNTGYAVESIMAVNTISDIDFGSPLNNTFSLGDPYLVEYDNTTSLKGVGVNNSKNIEATFAGYGTINGIEYSDNGTSKLSSNPDGTVYQKGEIDMKTKTGETAKANFESIGMRSAEDMILLDNGVMLFYTNSTGELAFLNNTMVVYKDMIDEARGNLTTIAWEWK